jgi:hypothetical protein
MQRDCTAPLYLTPCIIPPSNFLPYAGSPSLRSQGGATERQDTLCKESAGEVVARGWAILPLKRSRNWLLLDSRVVDLPMAYNPTFVIPSSLKPLFFNSFKNEFRFSDNVGA